MTKPKRGLVKTTKTQPIKTELERQRLKEVLFVVLLEEMYYKTGDRQQVFNFIDTICAMYNINTTVIKALYQDIIHYRLGTWVPSEGEQLVYLTKLGYRITDLSKYKDTSRYKVYKAIDTHNLYYEDSEVRKMLPDEKYKVLEQFFNRVFNLYNMIKVVRTYEYTI